MPTYDYACDECGEIFEYFQSYNSIDNIVLHCSKPMRRLIGASPVIFKAKGFYSTDSR